MAKSIEIHNYRGIKDLEVNDCRRINVVLGENGSGKTALLESIFLASGPSPELALRLRSWRGFEGTISGQHKVIEEAVWGELFHQFDKRKQISISLADPDEHLRRLRIEWSPKDVVVAPRQKNPVVIIDRESPIAFNWRMGKSQAFTSRPVLTSEGKLHFDRSKDASYDCIFFAANHNYSSSETAGRFSELSKSLRVTDAIRHFRKQYPIVEDLSLELSAGAPMVFAKKSGITQKVPVNSISGGMSKLAAILFAIPNLTKGIVLIDEIENGFYYRNLPDIWRALLDFCKIYDTQIFASTHSIECLRAAASVAAESPDDFSVIQIENEQGASRAHQFNGSRFVSAIDDHIEIR
jgi:predicted ATPase